jgi:GDPmannose 4,6-dehydratase
MKIALITGITGQDGSYLSELLLSKSYIVYGIIRRSSNIITNRIEHLFNNSNLHLEYGDLIDSTSLTSILNKIKNNHDFDILEVYNLGAMSHVKISFEMPEYTSNIDALGTLRLLECIRLVGLENKVRFYQASTSEMFGDVLEIPQSEKTHFNPQSPYAVAKLYSHYIVKNYRNSYDIFACNGILFNHESPRRAHNFVTRKVTIGLNKAIKDPNYKLYMGNIDALRDWGHTKDFVNGMWLMLQQDDPDDYVLATGEQYSVRTFIEKSFKLKGFDIKWKGKGLDEIGYDNNTGREIIFIDKKYFRPSEVETLLGDASKAKNKLGWELNYSFDELVKEMVDNDCE